MSITPPQQLDPSVQQQQQPPPMAMATEQAYSAHTGHGSVGPVIGVLAVITILGAIAVMVGRLCSGRGIFGHGPRYDFESWVETKCSSCVDGRVDSPAPRRVVVVEHSNSSRLAEAMPPRAAAARVETPVQDPNEEEEEEEGETLSDQANHNNHSHNHPAHKLERAEGH